MATIDIANPGDSEDALEAALRARLAPRGALAYVATTLNTQNVSAGVNISFTAERYDTDGCHDNSVNPQRMTVPTGWSWVRLKGQVFLTNFANPAQMALRLFHYNSAGVLQSSVGLGRPEGASAASSGYSELGLQAVSMPIPVTPGDYFTLNVITPDTSVSILQDLTWFGMELLA